MKVFLTGGTGCVGAHAGLALLRAGYKIRLFVRNPWAARRYFAMHGYNVEDIAVGDMRDQRAVRAAMHGCEAVLHAAAVVSLQKGRASEVLNNNLSGTESVIGGACAVGIRNIIYVSSLEVFAHGGANKINENSDLSESTAAYSRSKCDCERYVRALQNDGQPVHVVYPACVIGPDDPKLSEGNRALVTLLGMVPRTRSGMQCVDSRDLAQALRWLVENPLNAKTASSRWIVGGRYYPWVEIHMLLERITGRSIANPALPGAVLRFIGHAADAMRTFLPLDTQISGDAARIATQWTPAISGRYTNASGAVFRSGEETFTDTIRWLAYTGRLTTRKAGRLASNTSSELLYLR